MSKATNLAERPFSFSADKGGSVRIYWAGRLVCTLKATLADALLVRLEVADERLTQTLLAKATGQFKRGNERGAKTSRIDTPT